jgi:hypothetical protein
MASIPTKADFGDLACLDVDHAWKQFGGKTMDEAAALFASNPFFYQEDLLYMGISAFHFYFSVVLRYLTSDEARCDDHTVSAIATVLEKRLEYELSGMLPSFPEIRCVCDYVVSNYPKFEVDEDIWGNVKNRYSAIRKSCD